MVSHIVRDGREYSFEFKVAFWLVATFMVATFILWLALPGSHRAVPVLECTWPALLTGFTGLVLGKLS